MNTENSNDVINLHSEIDIIIHEEHTGTHENTVDSLYLFTRYYSDKGYSYFETCLN